MIIAAYAGAGKSEFAKRVDNSIDVTSMPYRWILPDRHSMDGETESLKAAPYLVANPLYVDRYVLDILKAENEYDYVIIPTSERIIDILTAELGRTVVICCPDISLKEEYKERYLARGNSEEFMEIFYGEWESNIATIQHIGEGICKDKIIRLTMKAGEYLADIESQLREIKNRIQPETKVSEEVIAGIEEELRTYKLNYCVSAGSYMKHILYPIEDIDTEEARDKIYRLGKQMYEEGLRRPLIGDMEMYKKAYEPDEYEIVSNLEELLEKSRGL